MSTLDAITRDVLVGVAEDFSRPDPAHGIAAAMGVIFRTELLLTCLPVIKHPGRIARFFGAKPVLAWAKPKVHTHVGIDPPEWVHYLVIRWGTWDGRQTSCGVIRIVIWTPKGATDLEAARIHYRAALREHVELIMLEMPGAEIDHPRPPSRA